MTGQPAAAANGAGELSRERADLLETLAKHRGFLRFTVRGLTDEQAEQRTTASELCLGGLIKHVCGVEARWMRLKTSLSRLAGSIAPARKA